MKETKVRRCTGCGQSDHNWKTCKKKQSRFMLYGFPTAMDGDQENFMKKKSLNLGNLQSRAKNNNGGGAGVEEDDEFLSNGQLYVSKRVTAARERKNCNRWTEEEHRAFLASQEHKSNSSRMSFASKENNSSHTVPLTRPAATPHGQGFPAGTMMLFPGGYGYMTSSIGRPPSPKPVHDQKSMFGDGASSAENDLLELRLGPPRS